VHDCGRVINPMLADGQVVGGIAQGVGGALCERLVYDAMGQPLSGSFMDYALPRADDLPPVELEHTESPSPRNSLGVKGLGKGGAIGPPAAIANAVEDALRAYGVAVRRGPLAPPCVHELMADANRVNHSPWDTGSAPNLFDKATRPLDHHTTVLKVNTAAPRCCTTWPSGIRSR